MGTLSNHFDREDFACSCDGCPNNPPVDHGLVVMLEDLAEHFGKRVRITSGVRCKAKNAQVGGALRSLHLTGKAADVVVSTVETRDVYDYLAGRYPDSAGLGLYNQHVHVDSRTHRYRWGNSGGEANA